MSAVNKIWGWAFGAVLSAVVVGCGGGSSGSLGRSSTLSGTAAVGAPIVGGTIAVICSGGSAVGNTVTDTIGSWTVTLSGQTLPCALQVSGGTINGVTNTTPYHSIASALGTVNVTPMTDLIVANAAGTSTPNTWFAAVTPTGLAGITPAAMTTALAQVRTALNLPALSAVNPLTTAFTPEAGNQVDDILTALQLAITNTGSSLAALRAAASNPTFTPPVGFSTAINTQHGNTSSGGAPAPAAPTNLVASGPSATTINLAWAAVSGATGYDVYRSTSSSVALTAANKIASFITTTAYLSSDLASSTTYYYKVTTQGPSGQSVGSNVATGTTLAAPTTGGGGGSSATPVITSFTPTTGAVGTSVSITGTNLGGFTPAPLIKFGTTNAGGPYSNVTATNATFTVPTGLAAGAYTITMSNFDGTNPVTAGTFTVTAAGNSGGGSSSGVTFSAAFGGASSIANETPTVSTGSGLTFQTYTSSGNILRVGYRLQLGVEEVNLSVTTTASSALNNGGFSGAPGSCALNANNFGAPLCSTFGITFDKTAGTVSFTNTPMGSGLSGNAPTVFTMTGALTFTPF
jgi:hypothetical protein